MSAIDTDVLAGLGLAGQDSKPAKDNGRLGQEDFMKLMITQLQNQDPLKPMENGEFLSQIAQFGTVSGIEELQQSFTDFSQSIQSGQALQAASLVDRAVVVPADTITLNPELGQWGSVNLPASATDVTISVHDQAGALVRQIPLGPQSAGDVEFAWDGLTESGELAQPGTYEFRAQATGAARTESLEVLLASRVNSVSIDNNDGLTLHVQGLGEVDFSQVRRIG
jgi:flagellar basal-body rod modification protein FlgD